MSHSKSNGTDCVMLKALYSINDLRWNDLAVCLL